MDGLISMVIIVGGAIYYFLMRLSGNKKAAEEDDIAGGAAWICLLIGGIFFSMYIVIPRVVPLLKGLEEPLKTSLSIILGLVCIYLPYKIACLVVPPKNKDK